MKNVKVTKFESTILGIVEKFGAVYTVPSAAKELGLERQTVYDLLESGNLEGGRAVDESGDLIKVVVSKRSVDAYKAWREQKAQATMARPSFA